MIATVMPVSTRAWVVVPVVVAASVMCSAMCLVTYSVVVVADVAAEARSAAESGMDEVIIEASYWNVVRSPTDWLEMPDRCLPVLEAAQSV